jgi:hypothetical protein
MALAARCVSLWSLVVGVAWGLGLPLPDLAEVVRAGYSSTLPSGPAAPWHRLAVVHTTGPAHTLASLHATEAGRGPMHHAGLAIRNQALALASRDGAAARSLALFEEEALGDGFPLPHTRLVVQQALVGLGLEPPGPSRPPGGAGGGGAPSPGMASDGTGGVGAGAGPGPAWWTPDTYTRSL